MRSYEIVCACAVKQLNSEKERVAKNSRVKHDILGKGHKAARGDIK